MDSKHNSIFMATRTGLCVFLRVCWDGWVVAVVGSSLLGVVEEATAMVLLLIRVCFI